jgi:hypothetical protein
MVEPNSEIQRSEKINPSLTIADISNSAQSIDTDGLATFSSDGAIVANREQLRKIIDLPALKAVEVLYDDNIQTYGSSANGVNFGDGTASVGIIYNSLSAENRQIADKMVEQGLAKASRPNDIEHRGGSKQITIHTQMELTSKVSDISAALEKFANYFKPQDILYGREKVTDDWLERQAKAYGANLSDFGSTRDEQVESFTSPQGYYDKQTGEIWASKELYNKHVAYMESQKITERHVDDTI